MKVITPSVGDIVSFYFYHRSIGERIEYGKVTDIIQRYGYCNNGTTKVSPLIEYINLSTGKRGSCDISFIKCIIIKAKGISKPYNIYSMEYSFYDKNDFNPFHSIIIHVLKGYNGFIPREVDFNKAYTLWEKNGKPGCLGIAEDEISGFFAFRVKAKVFKKWVIRNINKMMPTVKELNRDRTRMYQEYEEEYERHIKEEERSVKL